MNAPKSLLLAGASLWLAGCASTVDTQYGSYKKDSFYDIPSLCDCEAIPFDEQRYIEMVNQSKAGATLHNVSIVSITPNKLKHHSRMGPSVAYGAREVAIIGPRP